MFRTFGPTVAVAAAIGATLATAQIADAGGYVNNKCIGKKLGSLSKHTKSVGKAWDKYPSDMASRDTAIGESRTKLTEGWTKEETKASEKGADCSAATSDVGVAADAIEDALEGLSATPADVEAAACYASAAIKAYGKHIKDPIKDAGKAKLTESIAKAADKCLLDASGAAVTAAEALEDQIRLLTTTGPEQPSTFTQVIPGTEVVYGKKVLEPVCVDGDPYSFWFRKGTTNNVLMYYQGGGACWNNTSCYGVPGGTCKRTAGAGDNPDLAGTGFADYDNPGNPFSDWNIIMVSYCSCDVHWGENDATYPTTTRHRGRVNAAVAEKWARERFVDPDKVFVTGSSAGSYGAIMNSYWLMKEVWPNADYSVLGDGGIGVITQDFLNRFIDNWGISVNFPEDLPGVVLPVTNLSLVDLIGGLQQRFPNARFANYDTSWDGGSGSQCNFMQVMDNPDDIFDWPNWEEAACEWGACMRDFKAESAVRSANYKYFTDAGTRHTMFGSDKVYTSTKSTREDNSTGMTIADWVNAMVDDTADFVNVDCNNTNGDCTLTNTCQGGTNAGGSCTTNTDCNTLATCTGGTNPGTPCVSNAECTGGGFCPFCQRDPNDADPPFSNGTLPNCAGADCPCAGEDRCGGGPNDGLACATNSDCPDSRCQHVRCPTFTP